MSDYIYMDAICNLLTCYQDQREEIEANKLTKYYIHSFDNASTIIFTFRFARVKSYLEKSGTNANTPSASPVLPTLKETRCFFASEQGEVAMSVSS